MFRRAWHWETSAHSLIVQRPVYINTSLATTSPAKNACAAWCFHLPQEICSEFWGNKNLKVPTCPHVHQEASRCRCERPEGTHLPWLKIFVHPSSVQK